MIHLKDLSKETIELLDECVKLGMGHHLACKECGIEEGAIILPSQELCKHHFIVHIVKKNGKCLEYTFENIDKFHKRKYKQ